jgi:carbon storage regulator
VELSVDHPYIISYTEVAAMLVLSRRETERIRLGDSIVVTVVRVAGDKVRLGIEAPPDVLVLRDELQTHGVAGDSAGHEAELGVGLS